MYSKPHKVHLKMKRRIIAPVKDLCFCQVWWMVYVCYVRVCVCVWKLNSFVCYFEKFPIQFIVVMERRRRKEKKNILTKYRQLEIRWIFSHLLLFRYIRLAQSIKMMCMKIHCCSQEENDETHTYNSWDDKQNHFIIMNVANRNFVCQMKQHFVKV